MTASSEMATNCQCKVLINNSTNISKAAMDILNLKSVDDVIDDSKEQLDTILSDVSKAIVDHIYQKSNTNEIINVAVDKSVATRLHCVCKLEAGGDMIYYFNKNCQFGQWFHLECIGLSDDDIPEVSWFCSEICRNEKASARGNISDGCFQIVQAYQPSSA
jgi:hypothetical protein